MMKDYTEQALDWAAKFENDPNNIGKQAHEEYACGELFDDTRYEGAMSSWKDAGVEDNELVYDFTTIKHGEIWTCTTGDNQRFSHPRKLKAQAMAARYLDALHNDRDTTELLPGYKPPPTHFTGEPPF